MKLIADAGSTKTEWALLTPEGAVRRFETPGLNALMLSADELRARIREALGDIGKPSLTYYYGAGCVSAEVCARVAAALPCRAEVAGDLTGAARGLLGHRRGLACILGTGSNCGLYDGADIVANMAPMGYIIGDEGSGTAIGKALLRRVYRGGAALKEAFESSLGMGYGEVLERVYRRPEANRFLAGLARLIRPLELEDVVRESFDAFFAAIGARFPAERQIALTGGIAGAFSPELREAAARAGFEITEIQTRPMEGLIKYHFYGQ